MRLCFSRWRLALLLPVLILAGCWSNGLPAPSSQAYRDAVSAFYTGVTAVQVGEDFRAEGQLTRVTELAPGEPAAWADLGVLALRQQDYETATQHLDRALDLAPENGTILFLRGVLERERGRLPAAADFLRRAVAADSSMAQALFMLAMITEQRGGDNSAEALRLLGQLQQRLPNNLAVRLERARLAAKLSRPTALAPILKQLAATAPAWPPDVQEQFARVQTAAQAQNWREVATQLTFLENELKQLPAYRQDRAVVQTPPAQTGTLITQLLRLPEPDLQPAPPDTALHFQPDSLPAPDARWAWVHHLSLTNEGPPGVVAANGERIWVQTGIQRATTVPFPGGPNATPPGLNGLTGLDFDYDFRMDLAAAGAGGFRLYRQTSESQLLDVTDAAVSPPVRRGPYAGVWTADFDMEGDLDLLLATPDGPPLVLRNNGDGTFATTHFFDGIEQVRQFGWADIDADGDPDAALLDAAGRLHLYTNQRYATERFAPRPLPDSLRTAHALSVSDIDSNGSLDLVLLRSDGTLLRLSDRRGRWDAARLARWNALPAASTPASTRLLTQDFDNNGSIDVLAVTPDAQQLWLGDAPGQLAPLRTDISARPFSAADLRGEGRLDLVALTDDGTPVRLTNLGGKGYQSVSIRPRAARIRGDRRINPFGIGGEIELRAGLLFQKHPIADPVVHFGLGERLNIDVARILWPNGTVQAEFDLLSTQTALTRQRLKGSCPWVFTHDGDSLRFITDFLWRTALGLRINAQGDAAVIHGRDWVKVPGDALAVRNGMYDVRITAELWETHFFDEVTLMAVDHPVGTRIFANERFILPAPEQKVYVTDSLRAVAGAWDADGQNVTDLVRARDERYLDTFALGPYQGLAEPHYVEIDLGEDVPTDRPLWLVASGWVYPTDSSINVAIAQRDGARPHGVIVEVPDGNGGWKVVTPNAGFPAGKKKTMLIDLTDAFVPGTARRVRLRTNMEIYWDRLAWAPGRPETEIHTQRLAAKTATLRYRGYSAIRQKSRRAPELPIYGRLMATTQIWRDLRGYHTRFGGVRPLIRQTDDRYVIMNAGDELALRFPAPPPPPDGWARDFILIGDGWVKDGDYNTGYSTTVRPLPYHGMTDYGQPPVPLEQDPAYRLHPNDWKTYHTRYVTPRGFHYALTPSPSASRDNPSRDNSSRDNQ